RANPVGWPGDSRSPLLPEAALTSACHQELAEQEGRMAVRTPSNTTAWQHARSASRRKNIRKILPEKNVRDYRRANTT
ncbi:MAG: hypothetical protein PVF15_10720, partial [Candidatus Bathyarchaeota archaeon]